MVKITNVLKKCYGKKLGLKVGDDVISAGGYPFCDVLDYIYYDSETNFNIDVITKKNVKKTIVVNKPENVSLGLEFEELTINRCKNKCQFCFIDQLPKGMRETLYVKDDDFRFSFISGNYVTLTNLTENDFKRIIRLKLSPLYISVHAYDSEIRKSLVKNPNTVRLIEQMKEFAQNGIIMHTQVVLCEGINDGKVLEETVKGLYDMYPAVRTLAVVPVGLTCHRDGLDKLKPLSPECLSKTVDFVEGFNKGKDFCWCSDEFYVKAGRPVPGIESYGDFSQIENGVGLIAKFLDNLNYSLENISVNCGGKNVTMLTGVSFAGYLGQAVKIINQHFKDLNIKIQIIENNFFGKSITVAGLITGCDILAQTEKGAELYIIPKTMLKEFENIFLDGVSLKEIENALGRVAVADGLGENLVDILLSL